MPKEINKNFIFSKSDLIDKSKLFIIVGKLVIIKKSKTPVKTVKKTKSNFEKQN